jgi:hypothetical protein
MLTRGVLVGFQKLPAVGLMDFIRHPKIAAGGNPLIFQKKAGGAKALKSCLGGQSIQLDEDNGLEQYSDDLHDDLVKRENR